MSIVLFSACEDNERIELEETLSAEELAMDLTVDVVTEDIDFVIEQDEMDGLTSRSTTSSSIGNCVTRSVERTSTSKIVTLDFEEGCEAINGNFYSGTIIIEYRVIANGYNKTVTFDNFKVNRRLIEGTRAVEKVKENSNGNPMSTFTTDLTITFENGIQVERTGNKIREMIEGSETRLRGDDVVSVTGSWRTATSNGKERTTEVIIPLIRKFACKFFVSGTLEISKNSNSVSINFGEGECDNIATVTGPLGNTFEIRL